MAFTYCGWNEDAWKGATFGCSLFIRLFELVAEEHGGEEASAMLRKLGTTMGAQYAEALREQIGDQTLDAEKLSELVVGLDGTFGLQMEVEHEDDAFTLKLHNCPLAAAFKMLDVDGETGKQMCENWGSVFMDALTKGLAPNGDHRIVAFRRGWDGVCVERFSLGETA